MTTAFISKVKASKGISIFKGNFRVQFKLPDAKSAMRKSLGIMACPENLETATATLFAIKRDILNGTYTLNPDNFWIKHFPNSAEVLYTSTYTLDAIFDLYEKENYCDFTESLKSKFKSCKSWSKKHKLLGVNITDLTPKELNKARKVSAKKLTVSTVIEYSQTLRRIIDLAVEEGLIEYNPFTKVTALAPDDKVGELVKPFTQFEIDSLLEVIHVPQTKLMVEFLVWTGLRPGEMKALAWEDVFINEKSLTGYIEVNFNIDRKGKLKMPKTKASLRKVELFPETVKLLLLQKEKTFNEPSLKEVVHLTHGKTMIVERHRVFLSRENKPYMRPELTTTLKQWETWLRKANITHRPPYQLRHTYASRMLKAGANHLWLAKQMGHTDWGMIRIIYGTWIDEGNDEINKISSNLAKNNN